MKETNLGGYDITERRLSNGWYEISTLADSMGEVYRDSMRFDHQPTIEDYAKFLSRIEATK